MKAKPGHQPGRERRTASVDRQRTMHRTPPHIVRTSTASAGAASLPTRVAKNGRTPLPIDMASGVTMDPDLGAPAVSLELAKERATARTQASAQPRGLIHNATLVFWLMFLINVVNYLDRFVADPLGPTLKQEFNLADSQVGLLTTAFLLVYTIAGLPLGLLADRASRARIVAIGVGIWSIFSAYTAFARGFGELFASRIGVGIGEASYLPAGTALLSTYNPIEKRAREMSRW